MHYNLINTTIMKQECPFYNLSLYQKIPSPLTHSISNWNNPFDSLLYLISLVPLQFITSIPYSLYHSVIFVQSPLYSLSLPPSLSLSLIQSPITHYSNLSILSLITYHTLSLYSIRHSPIQPITPSKVQSPYCLSLIILLIIPLIQPSFSPKNNPLSYHSF